MAKVEFSRCWHSKIQTEMDAMRLALFAASLLLIGCRSGHPFDDSLQSRFFSHEASFTKVVQMATEDPKIVRTGSAIWDWQTGQRGRRSDTYQHQRSIGR
jgi:hypothetical protein